MFTHEIGHALGFASSLHAFELVDINKKLALALAFLALTEDGSHWPPECFEDELMLDALRTSPFSALEKFENRRFWRRN
jgi:hypothetical protein